MVRNRCNRLYSYLYKEDLVYLFKAHPHSPYTRTKCTINSMIILTFFSVCPLRSRRSRSWSWGEGDNSRTNIMDRAVTQIVLWPWLNFITTLIASRSRVESIGAVEATTSGSCNNPNTSFPYSPPYFPNASESVCDPCKFGVKLKTGGLGKCRNTQLFLGTADGLHFVLLQEMMEPRMVVFEDSTHVVEMFYVHKE